MAHAIPAGGELPQRKSHSTWIVSPAADLLFFIAAPLWIAPALWLLAQYCTTPERIALLVLSFASLGHHLPGFLRAYGDRSLFRRFRWRFLLAPPIALAISVGCFVWLHLHAIQLVLLLWATWHILMQTYGLMRIYDMKRGVVDAASAGLDFWLCVMLFAAGIVFSDSRVYGIVEVFWLTGFPLLGAGWLVGLRIAVGVLAAAVMAAYLVHTIRAGRGINIIKIALAFATGTLYWLTGLLATNMLVGVAMFEVFHAVQYFAIVWAYNRGSVRRDGAGFGPLRWLFGGWYGLPIYLAAIAGFGGAYYLATTSGSGMFPAGSAEQWATALFAASAMLHFYYDGFIWRVREQKTQSSFNVDGPAAAPGKIALPALRYAGYALLGAVLIGVFAMERFNGPRTEEAQSRLLSQLAVWTPNVPELQVRLSGAALARGDTAEAAASARRAVELRPRSHQAHEALGSALLKAGRPKEAAAASRAAIELNPDSHSARSDLVASLTLLGRHDEAIAIASAGRDRAPDSLRPNLLYTGALIDAARYEDAADVLEDAAARWRNSAELFYQLGFARLQLGDATAARAALERAIELDGDHARAYFHLAVLDQRAGREAEARRRYERCIALAPEFSDAYDNLGVLLHERGEYREAELCYDHALALGPRRASTHFNLGLLYLEQNRRADAGREILRASQLGYPVPAAVAAEAGVELPGGSES